MAVWEAKKLRKHYLLGKHQVDALSLLKKGILSLLWGHWAEVSQRCCPCLGGWTNRRMAIMETLENKNRSGPTKTEVCPAQCQ